MGIHRIRQSALALGLLAFLGMGRVGHCQTATGDEVFSIDTPAMESPRPGRPIPFYDADDPVVAPRETHAQRIPSQAVETPATTPTTRKLPETGEFSGRVESLGSEKTPLPETDFTDGTAPTPAARGRAGFGSSVAWAMGILAVGWLARQFLKSGGPLSIAAPSAIELLSRQSIGPQQQLALVRFGRRILLVGTTPSGMSTLATVDDPAEVQAIVTELRPLTTQVGPTLLDLFRSRRSEPTRDSAPASVSLSTHSRSASSDRRTSPPVNREVADV